MNNFYLFECLITAILVGLIWTIQLVHYPSFHFIDKGEFKRFETFHCQRMSIIVIPLMLIEGILALYHVIFAFDLVRATSLLLVIFIWLVTFFESVPCHDSLANGYDFDVVNRLIKSNWTRTIAWSLKLIILGVSYVYISN